MASTLYGREDSQRCSWLVYRDALPKDQVSEYELCAADLHDLSDFAQCSDSNHVFGALRMAKTG